MHIAVSEPANTPIEISKTTKGAVTIIHLLLLSLQYKSKRESSIFFWKVPSVNSPNESSLEMAAHVLYFCGHAASKAG